MRLLVRDPLSIFYLKRMMMVAMLVEDGRGDWVYDHFNCYELRLCRYIRKMLPLEHSSIVKPSLFSPFSMYSYLYDWLNLPCTELDVNSS